MTVRYKKGWNEDEIKALHEMRGQRMSNKEIANNMGRTVKSVEAKVYKICGEKRSLYFWKPEDDLQLMDLIAKGKSISQIAKETGRSIGSIKKRLWRLPKHERQQARIDAKKALDEGNFVHIWNNKYEPYRTKAVRSVFELAEAA